LETGFTPSWRNFWIRWASGPLLVEATSLDGLQVVREVGVEVIGIDVDLARAVELLPAAKHSAVLLVATLLIRPFMGSRARNQVRVVADHAGGSGDRSDTAEGSRPSADHDLVPHREASDGGDAPLEGARGDRGDVATNRCGPTSVSWPSYRGRRDQVRASRRTCYPTPSHCASPWKRTCSPVFASIALTLLSAHPIEIFEPSETSSPR